MTVTVDLVTEHLRTDTTSPQTWSHGGAASGVKGVLVGIMHGTSSTDHVTACSYGGSALTKVQTNTDTATEPGMAQWWFLGSSVPQGTQTVSYTPGSTTDDIHAVCITLLAATDLGIIDKGGVNDNATNPSVALTYKGHSGMAFGAQYTGLTAYTSVTAGTGVTMITTSELSGNFASRAGRQTTGGTSDFTYAHTSAVDDVALAVVAVGENIAKSATGSGGMTAGGSATTGKTTAKAYTGSGGMTAAGAATTGKATSKVYTASGGMTIAGAADTVPPEAPAVTQYYWGAQYWGARYWGGQYWALGFSPSAFSYTASGGMTVSGTVPYIKGKLFLPTGGATAAGAATLVKGKTPTGSGGVTAAGAATTSWHRQFAFTASGGVTAAGTATLVKGKIYTPTGGTTAAGTATLKKGRIYTGSGAALTGGAATLSRTFAYAMVASGALLTGGAAIVAHTVVKMYDGSGGAVIAGAATTSYGTGTASYPYVGSGGVVSGGYAVLARTVAWAYTASGGGTVAGSADTSSGGLNTWVGSGGAVTGGSADVSRTVSYSFAPSGSGAVLDGAADTLYHSSVYEYATEGGAELGGSATAFYLSIQDLRATDNSGIRRFVYNFTTPFAS